MPSADVRPPAVNCVFRPGTTITATLEWPTGSLDGEAFTSTLDDQGLSLSVTDDTMTIVAEDTITEDFTIPVQWVLSREIGGDDEPIIVGTWTPSDRPGGGTLATATLTQGSLEVTVNLSASSGGSASLPNQSQATLFGRAAAAGTGQPASLTVAEAKTLLAYAGADVANTPAGSIAATTVQTAIDELDATITDLPELAVSDPAKVPVATAGGVTTLDVDDLAWAPIVSRLTADSAGNSTTTPATTGLAVAIAASPAIYEIRGLIWFSAVAAADASYTWTTPGGESGRWTVGGPSATAAYEATSRLWSEALACGGSGTGANYTAMNLYGIFVAGSAGTLTLNFAQATSDATAVTIRAQSTLIARRIA